MGNRPAPRPGRASLRARGRGLGIVVMMLAVVAGLGACDANVVIAVDVRTFTLAHVPGAGITVETQNGDIIIREVPGLVEVEIEAQVFGAGADQGAAMARAKSIDVLVTRRPSGLLEIRLDFPSPAVNDEGAGFTINVPDTEGVDDVIGVTLLDEGGDLDIAGLMGNVYLESTAGTISVHDHEGDVIIQGAYCDVTATSILGDLSVYSSRGTIVLQDCRKRVSVSGSYAPIQFEAIPGSPEAFSLTTSYAQVEVVLPLGTLGTVTAKAGNSAVLVSGPGLPLPYPITGNSSEKTLRFTAIGPSNTITTSYRPVLITVE